MKIVAEAPVYSELVNISNVWKCAMNFGHIYYMSCIHIVGKVISFGNFLWLPSLSSINILSPIIVKQSILRGSTTR